MRRRLLELEQRAWRRVHGGGGQRLRLAAGHPVERVDHILGSPEPPRQRQPRHVHQRADGLEAQPLQRSDGLGVEAKRRDVERRELL